MDATVQTNSLSIHNKIIRDHVHSFDHEIHHFCEMGRVVMNCRENVASPLFTKKAVVGSWPTNRSTKLSSNPSQKVLCDKFNYTCVYLRHLLDGEVVMTADAFPAVVRNTREYEKPSEKWFKEFVPYLVRFLLESQIEGFIFKLTMIDL